MKVHFLGVGGSGASAIAAIAQAQGFEVSGCDKSPFNEFTTSFKKDQLFQGHSSDHLKGVEILAITPAITSLDPHNSELEKAKKRGIEILTWQEFMGKYLEKEKFVIAVCGTHGKSTTTAMIGQLLEDAGLDPTVELGAVVPKWGTNYRVGRSQYFITEADEFNDNYLASHPDITVVTTIEMDHPEYFKDFQAYKDSFEKFLLQTKGTVVANLEDPGVAEVLKWVMKESKVESLDYSKQQFNLKLQIPGRYNELNAKAAFQVGLLLGIEPERIRESLETFTGIGRRFEYLGEFRGASLYSDFGHHPTEIKVTAEAIKEKFPRRKIWLIFQPHMFSRTKALYDEFVKVFQKLPVDQIILIDIYPSREKDTGLVNSSQLAGSIKRDNVRYESPEELKQTLYRDIREGDIVFFMGAGDIDSLARRLVER